MDRSKFEKMLELLINEKKDEAEELFHDIVVEKSRDIYEALLNEEADEDVDESDDDDVDEGDYKKKKKNDEDLDEDEDDLDEDEDDLDEGFDLDEFEVEADPMAMGGDPTDDMIGDIEAGDDDEEDGDMDMGFGSDEYDDDEDIEDRIEDVEDALEQLKAEFDKLIGGEDDMGMEPGDDDDQETFGGDDEEGDDDDEEGKESFRFEEEEDDDDDDDDEDPHAAALARKESKQTKKSAGEEMREYVEKVGGDRYEKFGKMGDDGTNTKSAVAGKNDMGGTTQNIARTDTENGVEANKGKLKGSALNDQTPKDMSTGNVNVPGGKAGVKNLKKQSGGGLDNNSILKKDSADKSAQSTLNKVSTRAK